MPKHQSYTSFTYSYASASEKDVTSKHREKRTSIDLILGAGSNGQSSLSVSTSPMVKRLYIESPVTWKKKRKKERKKFHYTLDE